MTRLRKSLYSVQKTLNHYRKRYLVALIVLVIAFITIGVLLNRNVTQANERKFTKEQSLNAKLTSHAISDRLQKLYTKSKLYNKIYLENPEINTKKLEEKFDYYTKKDSEILSYRVFPNKENPSINISYQQNFEVGILELLKKRLNQRWKTLKQQNRAVITDFYLNPDTQKFWILKPLYKNNSFLGISAVLVDLKPIIDKYLIPLRTDIYGSGYLLDEKGNVIWDHENEIIGKNVFKGLHKEYPSLLKVDERVINEKSGTASYNFIIRSKNKTTRKLISWEAVELLNKKIVLCITTSDIKVNKSLRTLRIQLIFIGLIFLLLIIIFSVVFYHSKSNLQIKDAEEKYRTLFNNAEDGFLIMKSKIYDCNPKAVDILGFNKSEIIGSTPLMFSPKKQPNGNNSEKLAFEYIKKAFNGIEQKFYWQHKDKNGELIDCIVRLKSVVLNGEKFIYAIIRDITEKKIVETKLKESQKDYKILTENISDIIWKVDADFNIRYISPSIKEYFPMQPSYFIDKNILDINKKDVLPDKIHRKLKKILRVLKNNKDCRTKKLEAPITYNKKTYWFESKFNSFYQDDKLDSIIVVSRDINHIKKMEANLIEEKQQLKIILESINEGVIAVDAQWNIILTNKTADSYLSGNKSHDKKLYHLFNIKTDTDHNCKYIMEKFKNENLSSLKINNVKVQMPNTAQSRILACSLAPILNDDNNFSGMVIIFQDVTNKHKIEKELEKSKKLDAISSLSNGIAHDFNNLLVAILGSISLVKYNTSNTDKNYNILEEAEEASLKAKKLTQQLMSFSQETEFIKKNETVNKLIKETVESIFSNSQIDIQLNLNAKKDLAAIDKYQLEDVIQNLISNALESIISTPHIKIVTKNITITKNNILNLDPNQYIKISISDNGVGIPDENLDRIFDPYFTTKEARAGLGLFTSFSAIKKHNGTIAVKSQKNKGSTFDIYLPLQTKKISEEKTASEISKRKVRALIMDDEKVVRNTMKRMLEKYGFENVLKSDAISTIEEYKKSLREKRPFDLVILDLTIPGKMNGILVLEELKKIDPTVKAIISSGYYDKEVISNPQKFGFIDAIQKPYNLHTLKKILSKHI